MSTKKISVILAEIAARLPFWQIGFSFQ